jgi:hypothetical protein
MIFLAVVDLYTSTCRSSAAAAALLSYFRKDRYWKLHPMSLNQGFFSFTDYLKYVSILAHERCLACLSRCQCFLCVIYIFVYIRCLVLKVQALLSLGLDGVLVCACARVCVSVYVPLWLSFVFFFLSLLPSMILSVDWFDYVRARISILFFNYKHPSSRSKNLETISELAITMWYRRDILIKL